MGQFIAELPYEIPLSTVTRAMSAEKMMAKWDILLDGGFKHWFSMGFHDG
jgi:hypothetical protein